MKYLKNVVGIMSMVCLPLLATQVFAAEQTKEEVGAHYVVSDEEETNIRSFLDKAHFERCKQANVELHLQYAFGSILLKSKYANGRCLISYQREVELGDRQAKNCELDALEKVNWVREKVTGNIILMPPSCEQANTDETFTVDNNADPEAINAYLAQIDEGCEIDDMRVEYANQALSVKFDAKAKKNSCAAELYLDNNTDVLQTCSLSELQSTDWVYDSSGYMRDEAPDFDRCQVKEVNNAVQSSSAGKRGPVRDWLSRMFNMFFTMFVNARA